jgi:acetoacetate decarboxylase
MHPPAPWRLRGELTLIPARIAVADAGRFAVPPGARLLSAGGSTLGGVLLARYTGGTLAYHELIVFSALARLGARTGFVVSHIYVDSEASGAGCAASPAAGGR